MKVHVEEMRVLFFGTMRHDSYTLARAPQSAIEDWIGRAYAKQTQPLAELQFTESSSGGQLLDHRSILNLAPQQQKRGRASITVQACPQMHRVERLVGHRRAGKRQGGGCFFLVKWEGYTDSENTWEPESFITDDVVQSCWQSPQDE